MSRRAQGTQTETPPSCVSQRKPDGHVSGSLGKQKTEQYPLSAKSSKVIHVPLTQSLKPSVTVQLVPTGAQTTTFS